MGNVFPGGKKYHLMFRVVNGVWDSNGFEGRRCLRFYFFYATLDCTHHTTSTSGLNPGILIPVFVPVTSELQFYELLLGKSTILPI